MVKSAQYVLSAYSFIFTNSLDELLQAGYQSKGGNPIPSFDEDLLVSLCSEAQQVFEKESNILELEGDLIIVGDIHGSFHDLLRILKFIQEKNSKALFLGDYVDRGSFSLECITILFALKVLYPDTFYLIRGNHEFDSTCSRYGFKDEIINYNNPTRTTDRPNVKAALINNYNKNSIIKKSNSLIYTAESSILGSNYQYEDSFNPNGVYKCYTYTEKLYEAFIQAFSYLPIASIVNKTTFCIHGGLSPKLDNIESLNTQINRPIKSCEDNSLISDLIWSDPSQVSPILYGMNPRGCGYLFNKDAVTTFLNNSSFKRMIRAHQCVPTGIMSNFDDKCITVFSASSYDAFTKNLSGIIQLFQSDDSFKTTIFPPLERLEKIEAYYYKVQALNPTSEEKIHICFSLLHPKLLPGSKVRRGSQKSTRKIKSLQTDGGYVGSPMRRSPLVGTRFVTTPKRSYSLRKNPLMDILNDDDEKIKMATNSPSDEIDITSIDE